MPIQFEDGSLLDANDWQQIKRLLAQKVKQSSVTGEPPPKVTEIRSRDGVTVRVGNLELKKKAKMPLSQSNYVEGQYKGWTIRVWRQPREKIYGCNYFMAEDVRYFELRTIDVTDENGVFKTAKAYIEEAIAENGNGQQ